MRNCAVMLAYSRSKWMVRGISKSAAVDVAADNIRASVILPELIAASYTMGRKSPSAAA